MKKLQIAKIFILATFIPATLLFMPTAIASTNKNIDVSQQIIAVLQQLIGIIQKLIIELQKSAGNQRQIDINPTPSPTPSPVPSPTPSPMPSPTPSPMPSFQPEIFIDKDTIMNSGADYVTIHITPKLNTGEIIYDKPLKIRWYARGGIKESIVRADHRSEVRYYDEFAFDSAYYTFSGRIVYRIPSPNLAFPHDIDYGHCGYNYKSNAGLIEIRQVGSEKIIAMLIEIREGGSEKIIFTKSITVIGLSLPSPPPYPPICA